MISYATAFIAGTRAVIELRSVLTLLDNHQIKD